MAKRNPFIEQERRYKRKIKELTPQVFASFIIALHRCYGFGFKRCLRVLVMTQEIWNMAKDDGVDKLMQTCMDETGIDIMSAVTAKEIGAKGDAII